MNNYTKENLRKEITRIVKSHTLCSEGESLGASGNIIEIPLISAAPDMYEALKLWTNHQEGTRGHYCQVCANAIAKALAKAEGK